MKCRKCQYFNLPGADVCGRCGDNLSNLAMGGAIPADIYPKRARERTLAMRLEYNLGIPVRRAVDLATATRSNASVLQKSALIALSNSILGVVPMLSVVPGLGQFLQRRWKVGSALVGALSVSCLLFRLTLFSPASDIFLWMIGLISCLSVYEAALYADPNSADASPALRRFRLVFLSVGVVSTVTFALFAAMAHWYPVFAINTNQAFPALVEGDSLLTQANNAPMSNLHRGDVVIYRDEVMEETGTNVERVLGLPGDTVAVANGALIVNGSPLDRRYLPLTPVVTPSDMTVTLPPGTVAVWHVSQTGGGPSGPVLAVRQQDIQGRVVAIIEPPQRRKWFN